MSYERIVRSFLKLVQKLRKLVEAKKDQIDDLDGTITQKQIEKDMAVGEMEKALTAIRKLEEIFGES